MFLSQYVDSLEGKSFKINSDTDTVTYNCMYATKWPRISYNLQSLTLFE